MKQSRGKSYRETFTDCWSTGGYLCQTGLDETSELVRPLGTGQRWRVILSDVVQGTHSIHVEQRGLSLSYKQMQVSFDNTFNALIAFMLNSGGFLSATSRRKYHTRSFDNMAQVMCLFVG